MAIIDLGQLDVSCAAKEMTVLHNGSIAIGNVDSTFIGMRSMRILFRLILAVVFGFMSLGR